VEIFTDFESSQKVLIVLALCLAVMFFKVFKGIVKGIIIPLLLLGLLIWYFS